MDVITVILIIVCFFFAVFSSHLFFTKRDTRKITRFLSVIIFTRVGQILILLSVKFDKTDLFPILYKAFTPLYYLAPACLFLYVKFFLNEQRQLERKEYLHFVPFIIAIIHFTPLGFHYNVDWNAVGRLITASKNIFITEKTGIFPVAFMASLRVALMISYLIASWIVLIGSKLFKQKKWTINKTWIVFMLAIATLFHMISISSLFIDYHLTSFPWFLTLNCIGLTFVILYILHKPNLLYGYLLVNVTLGKKAAIGAKKPKYDDINKPLALVGTEDPPFNIQEMESLMKSKQPFLNPDFQIIDLAQEMGIPVHQCSQTINSIIGKNFRDWINSYRISFFIELYAIKKNQITIEALAKESGFKSLATFYNAFRKETGMMPKQYFAQEKQVD